MDEKDLAKIASIRKHLVKADEDRKRFGSQYIVGTINLDYLEYLLGLVEQRVRSEHTKQHVTDPLEKIILKALLEGKIDYETNVLALDFYLPHQDIYLEVKAMHSDRIGEQMSRASNVVAVQGRLAVEWLANLIRGSNGRMGS